MFGPELVQAFNEFKSLWDPEWKMNPGKVVMPYHPIENLRLGADFRPWSPKTHFSFRGMDIDVDLRLDRRNHIGGHHRTELQLQQLDQITTLGLGDPLSDPLGFPFSAAIFPACTSAANRLMRLFVSSISARSSALGASAGLRSQ